MALRGTTIATKRLLFQTEAPVRIDDFDIDEIIAVLKKAKLNRAAGPDHILVELYKWLNAEALEVIRRFFNLCWQNEVFPDWFTHCEVVTVFSKGRTDLPANYRPISLLNTLYKLMASIVQQQIAEGADDFIQET